MSQSRKPSYKMKSVKTSSLQQPRIYLALQRSQPFKTGLQFAQLKTHFLSHSSEDSIPPVSNSVSAMLNFE